MVVDAVSMLDELLPLNMIGIKKVQGGSLEVSHSLLVTFRVWNSPLSKHIYICCTVYLSVVARGCPLLSIKAAEEVVFAFLQ